MNRHLIAVLVLALAPSAALAHVAPTPQIAQAGAYTQVGFRVGHGCDGQATTALRIEIPEALPEVRTRDVRGWRLATEKTKQGRTTALTWAGRLPDDRFEVFELFFKAPVEAGPMTFNIVQTCGRTTAKWTPTVTVTPAQPASGAHPH